MKNLLFFSLLFPLFCTSQTSITFQTTIANDTMAMSAAAIEYDEINGGYIAVANSNPPGTILNFHPFLLQKMDDDGNLVWNKYINEQGAIWDHITHAQAVAPTSDGGYVCVGEGELMEVDPVYTGSLLTKTNSNGEFEWATKFGSYNWSIATNRVIQTVDGGLMLAGRYQNSSISGHNMFLIKTDLNGDTLWTKLYSTSDLSSSGPYLQQAKWIENTADGGYITCGETGQSDVSGNDALVVKFGANDEIEWSKTYGVLDSATVANCIIEKPGGGYVVAGYTGNWNKDGLAMCLDSVGNVIWANTFGALSSDVFNNVIPKEGGYVLTGTTGSWSSPEETSDVFIVELQANGNTAYSKVLGGTGADSGNCATSSPYSDYVVAGGSASFSDGPTDLFIAASHNGTTGCNETEIAVEAIPLTLSVNDVSLNIGNFTNLTVTHPLGLEEINFDHSADVLCHTNSVSEEKQKESFNLNVYPNPTNGAFQLSFPENTHMAYDVKVVNTSGQLIYTKESVNRSEIIRLNELPAGNYIIQASFNERSYRSMFGVVKR